MSSRAPSPSTSRLCLLSLPLFSLGLWPLDAKQASWINHRGCNILTGRELVLLQHQFPWSWFWVMFWLQISTYRVNCSSKNKQKTEVCWSRIKFLAFESDQFKSNSVFHLCISTKVRFLMFYAGLRSLSAALRVQYCGEAFNQTPPFPLYQQPNLIVKGEFRQKCF